MQIIKNHILTENGKKPILLDLYYKENDIAMPLLIFCHGYKGFKDWGAWHLVAEAFANAGFCFLKFNFSHNGGTVSEPIDFPDLEAFAENNYSIELEDLDRVLEFVASKNQLLPRKINSVSLLGHSRGGGTVLIKALENNTISKVVTWAGVSNFERLFKVGTPHFENWKKTGITYVENTRTKQQMPHNFQFYLDYFENKDTYNIEKTVKTLKIPYLIVHGDADTSVPISEAEALHSYNSKSILKIIPGADHVFGAKHPWHKKQLTEDLKAAVQKTIDFLKQPFQ